MRDACRLARYGGLTELGDSSAHSIDSLFYYAVTPDAQPREISPILVEPDRAGLEAITALVESGALRVHVDATFPLADAGKAHALGETGRT